MPGCSPSGLTGRLLVESNSGAHHGMRISSGSPTTTQACVGAEPLASVSQEAQASSTRGTDREMTWAMGGMLVFGVFGLVYGIRIRAGESRTFYPRYRTNYMY